MGNLLLLIPNLLFVCLFIFDTFSRECFLEDYLCTSTVCISVFTRFYVVSQYSVYSLAACRGNETDFTDNRIFHVLLFYVTLERESLVHLRAFYAVHGGCKLHPNQARGKARGEFWRTTIVHYTTLYDCHST